MLPLPSGMLVRVLLFGPFAARVGRTSVRLDVPEHAPVSDIRDRLASDHPELGELLPACRIAINGSFAGAEQRVGPGDELALIGMVSGG